MGELINYISGYLNWWLIAVLFMVGFYGIITKGNLLKKVMGMNVMQVSVILFYLNSAQKTDTTLGVLLPGAKVGVPDLYVNPLPHALMLTAIVVALALNGVALALLLQIYRQYGSLEESQVFRGMHE